MNTKTEKRNNLINDLKAFFKTEQIWTREDIGYWNTPYKREHLNHHSVVCCIETEDCSKFNFDRLHYDENFWGSNDYNNLLDKHKAHGEWYDNCITYITIEGDEDSDSSSEALASDSDLPYDINEELQKIEALTSDSDENEELTSDSDEDEPINEFVCKGAKSYAYKVQGKDVKKNIYTECVEDVKKAYRLVIKELHRYFYNNQYDEERYPHFMAADLITDYDPELEELVENVVFYN